jgi:serine/threonine protein kinase
MLLHSKGYYLHPKDDWHSMSIAKASSDDGCVVALKYLAKARNRFELQILWYLQDRPEQPDRKYVITLIDTIADARGDIIVMPSLWPLETILERNPHTMQTMRTQFLEAVSFLHKHKVAHLDLKPGNALVDIKPSPRLSLIDFGLSIFVDDETTEVVGYRGTPTWSAPEVGTVDGPKLKFKAILADRWSCGKVLQFITQHEGSPASECAHGFDQLLRSDPQTRPPLEEVLQVLQSQSSSTKPMAKRSPGIEGQCTSAASKRVRTGR